MRQSELNRRVAHATGESVATIRRLGFLLAEPATLIVDPEDESLGATSSIGMPSTISAQHHPLDKLVSMPPSRRTIFWRERRHRSFLRSSQSRGGRHPHRSADPNAFLLP